MKERCIQIWTISCCIWTTGPHYDASKISCQDGYSLNTCICKIQYRYYLHYGVLNTSSSLSLLFLNRHVFHGWDVLKDLGGSYNWFLIWIFEIEEKFLSLRMRTNKQLNYMYLTNWFLNFATQVVPVRNWRYKRQVKLYFKVSLT